MKSKEIFAGGGRQGGKTERLKKMQQEIEKPEAITEAENALSIALQFAHNPDQATVTMLHAFHVFGGISLFNKCVKSARLINSIDANGQIVPEEFVPLSVLRKYMGEL